jgi:hypothetical protein
MSDAVERAETHAVFVEYVRRELPSHGDKLEAARHVEALLANPVWGVVERLVDAKVRGLMNGMSVEIRPHGEYIAAHSQCLGMRTVLDIPKTIKFAAAESAAHEEAQAG